MKLFLMLLSALFTDAIVMDGKVKEAFVRDMASVTCNYDPFYKDYPKYGVEATTVITAMSLLPHPNSTSRVSLKDTGMQFIITLMCLTKEDTGWYWCGIQRNYASDYMDYTKLIVFDNVEDKADVPKKQNRSCKVGSIGCSGNHSRKICQQPVFSWLSILFICILILGVGVVTTAAVLLRRKRIQKRRKGKILIRLGDHSLGSSTMIPMAPMAL